MQSDPDFAVYIYICMHVYFVLLANDPRGTTMAIMRISLHHRYVGADRNECQKLVLIGVVCGARFAILHEKPWFQFREWGVVAHVWCQCHDEDNKIFSVCRYWPQNVSYLSSYGWLDLLPCVLVLAARRQHRYSLIHTLLHMYACSFCFCWPPTPEGQPWP